MRSFILAPTSRPAMRHDQPHIQWVPGALSSGLKLSGRETDHLPNLVQRLKIRGVIPTFPQFVFMASYLVKHRDFTF
jgi:hypothetical protein